MDNALLARNESLDGFKEAFNSLKSVVESNPLDTSDNREGADDGFKIE